jgi:hypothetical protein
MSATAIGISPAGGDQKRATSLWRLAVTYHAGAKFVDRGRGVIWERRISLAPIIGRGESADRPVCPRLPISRCIAANRRSGPYTRHRHEQFAGVNGCRSILVSHSSSRTELVTAAISPPKRSSVHLPTAIRSCSSPQRMPSTRRCTKRSKFAGSDVFE